MGLFVECNHCGAVFKSLFPHGPGAFIRNCTESCPSCRRLVPTPDSADGHLIGKVSPLLATFRGLVKEPELARSIANDLASAHTSEDLARVTKTYSDVTPLASRLPEKVWLAHLLAAILLALLALSRESDIDAIDVRDVIAEMCKPASTMMSTGVPEPPLIEVARRESPQELLPGVPSGYMSVRPDEITISMTRGAVDIVLRVSDHQIAFNQAASTLRCCDNPDASRDAIRRMPESFQKWLPTTSVQNLAAWVVLLQVLAPMSRSRIVKLSKSALLCHVRRVVKHWNDCLQKSP